MKLFRNVLILSLVGGLLLCALSSDAIAQKKGKGQTGKVTKLELKKSDDGKITSGTFTIEFKKNKKDTETMKKTYTVTKDTKVQKGVLVKKGDKKEAPTAAEWADVKEGSFVRVEFAESAAETATVVTFFAAKKKATN